MSLLTRQTPSDHNDITARVFHHNIRLLLIYLSQVKVLDISNISCNMLNDKNMVSLTPSSYCCLKTRPERGNTSSRVVL